MGVVLKRGVLGKRELQVLCVRERCKLQTGSGDGCPRAAWHASLQSGRCRMLTHAFRSCWKGD